MVDLGERELLNIGGKIVEALAGVEYGDLWEIGPRLGLNAEEVEAGGVATPSASLLTRIREGPRHR